MQRPAASTRSELAMTLDSCRRAFISIAVFSGVSNVLMLTGSIFMLEVYDRVLPSRSVPTLVGLVILAGILYVGLGLLDHIRTRLLVRIGARLDEMISGRVYDAMVSLQTKIGARSEGSQPLRDLDAVRSFLSGLGPIALFDLPWIPLYLIICFAFHVLIGLAALAGAIILCILTWMTEKYTRAPSKEAAELARSRANLAEASRRNAEVLTVMGMAARLSKKWWSINHEYMACQQAASDAVSSFASTSKVFRMLLQSAVLAVGAYLVINQQATAGIIIASSILSGRALAPVDLAIANWKGFVAARQSWSRLNQLLALFPVQSEPTPLEPPTNSLGVEMASVAPPGSQKLTAYDINFNLEAGDGLAVIGPSGSGKSCLARMLVGAWQLARGKVRLDGAAYDQWDVTALGQYIGYVPQDVELLEGSVAQNIARFTEKPDPKKILAAARAAGVHDLIINLPQGYDTPLGENGGGLSAGQAQRIALARALYGDPFLVVLDEPNSNLDADGDEALLEAILSVRARKGIVIVVAHRPSAIAGLDLVLVMNAGRQVEFGPKESTLAKILKRQIPPAALKVVPEAEDMSA
jgi:PrtD family type I secretion system ABC transporter